MIDTFSKALTEKEVEVENLTKQIKGMKDEFAGLKQQNKSLEAMVKE
jgi:uncharacterized coiled-coil protein SlyX